ncbi:50ce7ba6-0193-4f39-84d7-23bed1b300e7 [Thermothielavioides terrestris]|uniref:50ce7ba6-0193-4f39-84d7-23bed1b300e7 n=1 Tax=Thermothielavioides terrestris TaxID=2587410 RepID=A0A3S4ALZ1_9PEZI|nr:50ce7ba6-0193-4f39-84d7-23bed1b300e7 [Thermothielavioides terrestris]
MSPIIHRCSPFDPRDFSRRSQEKKWSTQAFRHRPSSTAAQKASMVLQALKEGFSASPIMVTCPWGQAQSLCNLDPENERGPCLSCKKIASSTKVYRLNCLRLKITDVKLFKPGQVKGQEWTNRWKDGVMDDIGNWESSEVRTIHVTEGYTGKSVRLQVRQFKPQPGDSLERKWVSKNGTRQTVQIPAFAIVNLDDAKAAFDQYIKLGLLGCCDYLLGPRDELLSRTYSLAISTAKDIATPLSERSLLMTTLDLWMSVRLTTKSFEIVGDDTLGMPRDIIKDQDNPLHGKIPLPPVMGAQIDSVIIHQIQPRLRRKTLEELQKMTQEKKPKTWLTTYLVTFILLHNIALITKHDADYARKHGLNRRFAREANVKEYNLGANTLLAYFHYCNKATYPFSSECKDQDLRALAELDDDAISFVHYTRQFVADHRKEWEDLWIRDDYENEFYYVSQLFEQNWQPRTMA